MTDKSCKAVPRVPTSEMIKAALDGALAAQQNKIFWGIGEIWIAMFDAAPVLATAPAEPPKDGEVAALIDAYGKAMHFWGEDGGEDASLGDDANQARKDLDAALARLSAPV